MAVATFTKSGTKATTPVRLDSKIFGVKVENHDLLKQAYLGYLANERPNLAQAKRRGDVRGGGRKPWRQKGTGQARFGSRRNPIWRGGGVAFGPTGSENYSKNMNTKAKRQALRQALSLASSDDKLIIVETFDAPDGKVKPTITLLRKIGANGSCLIVVSQKDEMVERATSNLPGVKAVFAKYLTVFDILNADHVLLTKKSLEIINAWLGGVKPKPETDK